MKLSAVSDDLRDRVKQAIDPDAYKTYLSDLKRSGPQSSGKYLATCPFHNDSHPSLTVEYKRDAWVWYCHPCAEGGDLFDLVKRKLDVDFPEALRQIASDLHIEDNSKRINYDPKAAQKDLQANLPALDYLSRRGISAETAKDAELGFLQYPGLGPAITIPYKSGVVKLRALSPNSKANKFRHLNGPSSNQLFGIERIEEEVFGVDEIHVVESELDALTMRQAGFTTVSVSSATTCLENGELRLDPEHTRILQTAERIFIWTDQDDAGQKCADAFEKALPSWKVYRIAWTYRGKESGDPKDVGELYTASPENFRETIRRMHDEALNRPPKWRTLFKSRSQMDTKPMEFLIEQFLPEGITFLGALSGSGKTWLCLSMAKAIATGQKFLGHFPVPEPSNVLYLIPESGERSFRQRMDAMGIPEDRFLCRTMTDGRIDLDDPELIRAVKVLRPVVFLDTAIRFSRAENENDASQSAKHMADMIFALCGAGARAIVGVHHSAKAAAKKDKTLENSLRGSGDLGAMLDCAYALTVEDHNTLRVRIENVKARDFEPVKPFVIQGRPFINETQNFGLIADIEEPEFTRHQREQQEKFVAAISEDPLITYDRLQRELGISSRNTVQRIALRSGYQKQRDMPWQKVSQTVN